MKFSPSSSINTFTKVSFGKKTPSFDDLKNIGEIVNCQTGGLVKRVTERVEANPEALKQFQQMGEDLYPVKSNHLKDFANSFVELGNIPRRLFTSVSEKLHSAFPGNKFLKDVFNSDFVQNHFKRQGVNNDIATLKGIYDSGARILEKNKGLTDALCECGQNGGICQAISKSFNKALNETLAWGKPKYATKDERLVTRLVSGLTAAVFMGKDFLNKALMQGKSEEEAKKDMRQKTKQEVIANIGEGVSQFCFLATFPLLANTKQWIAPVVSAGIGFTFNIISRLMAGMPLTRKEVPPKLLPFGSLAIPMSVEDFANRIKEGAPVQKPLNGISGQIVQEKENKKKSLLSLKNILIACGVSIAGGFVLRYGRIKLAESNIGKSLKNRLDTSFIGEKIKAVKASHIEEIFTNQKEINSLTKTLGAIDEPNLAKDIQKNLRKSLKNIGENESIQVGARQAITKGMEVPRHELHKIILAPFKFIKNVVTFPYQKALSLAESQGWVKAIEKPKAVFDTYDINNILLKFRELKEVHKGDHDKFIEAFKECIQKGREVAANNITTSKIENQKVTVTAQVLGMLLGINFNMNDDFNKTVDNGGTKEEGEKAARLRGLNKFMRTSIQAVVAGTLNNTLVKYYNMGLLKSGAITLVATAMTDVASRAILGMPFTKMSKEEQEAHNEKQEKTIVGKIKKLAE